MPREEKNSLMIGLDRSPFLLTLAVFLTLALAAAQVCAQEKKDQSSLNESEELTQKYLETFKKTGVPTPKTIEAAFLKAKSEGAVSSWEEAARIANNYANVIDVLTSHYSKLYYASRSGRGSGDHNLISKAADYERVRNRYLKMRNDAYIELARLYLTKGDGARALSYLSTAVRLSGVEPNLSGETLIKQIIQYAD
jgi:hypothetical protein